MGKYRLPFGAETYDVDLYVETWKTLEIGRAHV